MSLAIIGSKINDVFPVPEIPTTSIDSKRFFSEILIVFPDLPSLHNSISQEWGPRFGFFGAKLIPLYS